jgi:lysophospholipase L1-like esterase
MRLLALLLLTLSAWAADPVRYALPSPEAEANLPGEGALRRYDGYVRRWNTVRPQWADEVAKDQGAVVFFGDSITQGWGADFRKSFDGMKLANRGIGGDTTRGMLIRLQEDVLSLRPKAVVLLMGTNDIEVGVPAEAIGRNFGKIVAALKAHDPKMPVIVCRIFPSSAAKKRLKETIQAVNELLAATVKGEPQFTVLDTYALFADAEGDALPALFPDLLHLNAAGYAKWASALRPLFATLGQLDAQADDFMPEEGFVSLFNGKRPHRLGLPDDRAAQGAPKPGAPLFVEVKADQYFDGRTESPDGRYRAVNGRLVVTTPAEGRRIQALWTRQEFPRRTSSSSSSSAPRPTPTAASTCASPSCSARDFLVAGPYKDLKRYKPQEWNELVVTVKDGVARAECNGEVLEAAPQAARDRPDRARRRPRPDGIPPPPHEDARPLSRIRPDCAGCSIGSMATRSCPPTAGCCCSPSSALSASGFRNQASPARPRSTWSSWPRSSTPSPPSASSFRCSSWPT